MNMAVGKTLFRKKVSHLITYDSALSKTQIDYCLVRRGQKKLLKDVKVLPRKEYHLARVIGMQF